MMDIMIFVTGTVKFLQHRMQIYELKVCKLSEKGLLDVQFNPFVSDHIHPWGCFTANYKEHFISGSTEQVSTKLQLCSKHLWH